MRVFFDTSSFVKSFVNEIGSNEVDTILASATELGLSIVCFTEIISALNSKIRQNSMTKGDYLALKVEILAYIEDADIVNLTPNVLQKTVILLEENILRTLDAIHIACALEWQTELFVSSDKRQVTAAINAGLDVKFIG